MDFPFHPSRDTPHKPPKQLEIEEDFPDAFNSSAAKQANSWLDDLKYMLLKTDYLVHDFFLYTFINYRNKAKENV